MTKPISLSVLDLVNISFEGTARSAVADTIRLARKAESWNYHRYWVAEHHLTAGLAAASPVPIMATIAAGTSRIRVGSGATLTGHRTALSIAEDFATLAALAPGRIDLGLGRSGARGRAAGQSGTASINAIRKSPRFAWIMDQLQQEAAIAADHGDQVADILRFLADEVSDPLGARASAFPGGARDVEVWALGSSAGQSAEVGARHGLPFTANFHMNPADAEDAAAHYRQLFQPSAGRSRPYLALSVEVFTAATAEAAERGAARHLEWIRRQRTGRGLTTLPGDDETQAHIWTPEETAAVADRRQSLISGTPDEVVSRLREVATRFSADELIISTISAYPAEREESYRLLAEAWHDAAAGSFAAPN